MLGCFFALAPLLSAQVNVELTLDQDQFLAGESIQVGVRITNFSGQTLVFGKEGDWVQFAIEGRNNYIVPSTGEVPVQGEFEVESSTVVTRRVDVAPYFALTRPGRYLVTATVNLKQWDKQLVTRPKTLDVIAGTKLWEQEVGLSTTPGQPPEARSSRSNRPST